MKTKYIVLFGVIAASTAFFFKYSPSKNTNIENSGKTELLQSSTFVENAETSKQQRDSESSVHAELSTEKLETDANLIRIEKAKSYLEQLGIREDRYSLEQLAIIQKHMDGKMLTDEEAEIHFAYFLDMMFRLPYENMALEDDFQKKNKDWLVVHTYNDSLDYWDSLAQSGELIASEALGIYYQSIKHPDKAYKAYMLGFVNAKNKEDKGRFLFSMAETLIGNDDLKSAALFYLAQEKFGSDRYTTKYTNLKTLFTMSEIERRAEDFISNINSY